MRFVLAVVAIPNSFDDSPRILANIAQQLGSFFPSVRLSAGEMLSRHSTRPADRCQGDSRSARLNCIDAWNTLSDHNGKAINAAINVYESLEKSDCSALRQKAAQLAAKSYAKLKDTELAVFWTRKCIEESRGCSKLIQSRAALVVIECEFLTLSGSEDARGKYAAAMGFI